MNGPPAGHGSDVADIHVLGMDEDNVNRARGDWDVRTETRTLLTCTPTTFVLDATLDAYEGARRLCSLSWSRTIPRDGV